MNHYFVFPIPMPRNPLGLAFLMIPVHTEFRMRSLRSWRQTRGMRLDLHGAKEPPKREGQSPWSKKRDHHQELLALLESLILTSKTRRPKNPNLDLLTVNIKGQTPQTANLHP